MPSAAAIRAAVVDPVRLETDHLELAVCRKSGKWYLRDTQTDELFGSGHQPYGDLGIGGGKPVPMSPKSAEAAADGQSIRVRFEWRGAAGTAEPAAVTYVFRVLPSGRDVDLSVATSGPRGAQPPLLWEALWLAADEPGYFVVPQGAGWLIRAGQKVAHRFLTHAGRAHLTMQMFGVVRNDAALVLSWNDVNACVDLRTLDATDKLPRRTALSFSQTGRLRMRICGKGDYFTVARNYRELAREKGLLVPFAERVKRGPAIAKMPGAFDVKLWMKSGYKANCRFSKDPEKDQFHVERTFDDALATVRHLHDDLGFRRCMVVLAGWIRGGYDFSHPDIWPPDDDLGGPAGLARVTKFTQGCGFLFGLHDNYDMMFKAQPSANEAEAIGEHNSWAGGPQYILHPKVQAKYAVRNLEFIRQCCRPDVYYIDQTMANGLYSTDRRDLPLTRGGCVDVYREMIGRIKSMTGVWGSEDGQEWAVPVGEYHEGILSRDFYPRLGEPIPLFDLVYHDCAATFWHQGMTISLAENRHRWGRNCADPAHYLSLLSIARTPLLRPGTKHWWKTPTAPARKPEAPRRRVVPVGHGASFKALRVVSGGVGREAIWAHPPFLGFRGTVRGEYPVQLPDADGLSLRFAIGLRDGVEKTDGVRFRVEIDGRPRFDRLWSAPRWSEQQIDLGALRGRTVAVALITDPNRDPKFDWAAWGAPRIVNGRGEVVYDFIGKIGKAKVQMVELPADAEATANVFARADRGWAEGMHPLDAAIKNTYEFLSPANELAFFLPITRYERRANGLWVSAFGDGALEVAVNMGDNTVEHAGAALPPRSGFLVRSPTFLALHAAAYRGIVYAPTALFTVRSLDGEPIERSGRLRVFHGFGPSKLALTTARRAATAAGTPLPIDEGKLVVDVKREATLELR